MMTGRRAALASLLLISMACGGGEETPPAAAGAGGTPPAAAGAAAPGTAAPSNTATPAATPASTKFVEGKDYVVVERVRILDSMGFDQPIVSQSMLVPRGYQTEASVQWKSTAACRGEIISTPIKVTSPDGAIRFESLPVRSFSWTTDQYVLNVIQAAAQRGGCQISRPFDAAQWLQQTAASNLGGAQVSNVRKDERLTEQMDRANAIANNSARQYGLNMVNSGSAINADLTWPDGSQGITRVGVSVIHSRPPNMYGPPVEQATTMVFFHAYVRYPAARRDEGLGLFHMLMNSHRVSPAWQQAKDQFLAKVGEGEHQIALKTIRLMGEQARDYYKGRMEEADATMRSWERRQATSDASHENYIRSIREVEIWKTSDGQPVELNAGYHHGWSRPDGSYILTNNSLFNPAVEFQQNWTQMNKVEK